MAALVGVCDRTIQTWVYEGVISYIKIGKIIRFNPMRVLRDLEAFEVPAKNGTPCEADAESSTQTRHVDESQGVECPVPCCVRLDGIDGNVEVKGAECSRKRAGSAPANGHDRPN